MNGIMHTHILCILFRFQYILAAATSIATKSNEETITYLNQGQSYEIKLKKLGDLSPFRGKVLKVNIRRENFIHFYFFGVFLLEMKKMFSSYPINVYLSLNRASSKYAFMSVAYSTWNANK